MLINLSSQYAPWLPSRLFANGQQGVWYVPQPVYRGDQVLYQDAAATTPVTADGDPVGWMRDLSGNGNHATQSTTSEKPIYRTDGTLHWLETDGVDDALSFQLLGAGVLEYHAAFLVNSTSERQRLIASRRLAHGVDETGKIIFTTFEVVDNITNLTASSGVGYVTGFRADGSSYTVWLNSESESDGQLWKDTRDNDSFTLFSRDNRSESFGGRFYGAVIHKSQVNPNVPATQSYLSNLAGITL